MVKRKIIIDTDCGGDDVCGILVAAQDPDVEIVALTVVWGNVDAQQGVVNLAKTVDVIGKDIPIFIGAEQNLLGGKRETTQWYGFGKDGCGDANLPPSPKRVEKAKQEKHAALAMIDFFGNLPDLNNKSGGGEGEEEEVVWQLFAIGPLTNLALALQLCPTLFKGLGSKKHQLPGVTLMGGATHKGNASLFAEFNFRCDPEAARVVFNNKSSSVPILIVTWEITVDCCVPWELYDRMVGRPVVVEEQGEKKNSKKKKKALLSAELQDAMEEFQSSGMLDALSGGSSGEIESKHESQSALLEASPTMAASGFYQHPRTDIQQFLLKILKKFEETSRPAEVDLGDDEVRTQDTAVICDAVAIAMGLYPRETIKESIKTFSTIELAGEFTRGGLAIDWYGKGTQESKGYWVNSEVPIKANIAKVLKRIASMAFA